MASRSSVIRLIIIIAVVAALIVLGIVFDLARYLREALEFIEGLGAVGVVIFVGLYILTAVLLIPGSILTLGAGAVYGVILGTVYVSVASTLAATVAFLIGRYALRDWVGRKLASSDRLRAVDDAIGREGGKIVFLLRLSPLFPYSASNYIYSLTKVKLGHYVLASWAGMLPGTIMYVYLGSLANTVATVASEGRERTLGEWVLYGVGLLATVAVTLYVTRLARRAIKTRVPGVAEQSENGEENGDPNGDTPLAVEPGEP